jgi:hypothetical protein
LEDYVCAGDEDEELACDIPNVSYMKPKGRHDRYSAAEEAYFEKEKEGADQIEHAV